MKSKKKDPKKDYNNYPERIEISLQDLDEFLEYTSYGYDILELQESLNKYK